ncbi:MAG: hypothetical protein Q8R69_14860 [Telluria sp.]|nr:hypothetical protein [Telluria sp.]
MNTGRLLLTGLGLVLLACLTGLIAAAPAVGPGMTVTYNSAIKDMEVTIENARLPDGGAFPHGGGIGGKSRPNENPLNGGKTMGAAPDGRQLPEYIDFEWRESALEPPDPTPMDPFSQARKDWETKMMAEFYTHPIKKQRVFIRSRVPVELVNKVIEANRHTVKGHVTEASIGVYFIWTDYGIKLRWQIWHRPAFNGQYYSDEGGDEIVPSGTTMIAAYSNSIKNDRFTVAPGSHNMFPTRYPAYASGSFFSGAPAFAYTNKPVSGGEKLMAFESEPELPEWVEFNWGLFPILIPRKSGESDSAYSVRISDIYDSLEKRHERIEVRSRIPQKVQDEITAATRNAQPHNASSSLIYLYFIWTDSGIKLHWRLKRSLPDGSFISVREGGDELTQAAER